jgi:hypothetical protein
MCGSTATKTTTPTPAPTRQQIRSAIRKVARTMKTARTTDSYTLTASVMKAGGWNDLNDSTSYNQAWDACKKAIFASKALFSQKQGVCGRTDLTLKPGAKL